MNEDGSEITAGRFVIVVMEMDLAASLSELSSAVCAPSRCSA